LQNTTYSLLNGRLPSKEPAISMRLLSKLEILLYRSIRLKGAVSKIFLRQSPSFSRGFATHIVPEVSLYGLNESVHNLSQFEGKYDNEKQNLYGKNPYDKVA